MMRIATRYEYATLPQFGNDGLDGAHRIEVWLEGSY